MPQENQAQTLSQKVWDAHVVRPRGGRARLLYIDLHLVTRFNVAPGVRSALRLGRPHRSAAPDLTLATMDHNVPTQNIDQPVARPGLGPADGGPGRKCAEFGIRLYPMGDVLPAMGIVPQ